MHGRAPKSRFFSPDRCHRSSRTSHIAALATGHAFPPAAAPARLVEHTLVLTCTRPRTPITPISSAHRWLPARPSLDRCMRPHLRASPGYCGCGHARYPALARSTVAQPPFPQSTVVSLHPEKCAGDFVHQLEGGQTVPHGEVVCGGARRGEPYRTHPFRAPGVIGRAPLHG